MSKLTWRDETSHSQSDKERMPRTWVMECGDIRLVVTRHIHHDPEAWILRAEPFVRDRVAKSRDLEKAKAELVARVLDAAKLLVESLS